MLAYAPSGLVTSAGEVWLKALIGSLRELDAIAALLIGGGAGTCSASTGTPNDSASAPGLV